MRLMTVLQDGGSMGHDSVEKDGVEQMNLLVSRRPWHSRGATESSQTLSCSVRGTLVT